MLIAQGEQLVGTLLAQIHELFPQRAYLFLCGRPRAFALLEIFNGLSPRRYLLPGGPQRRTCLVEVPAQLRHLFLQTLDKLVGGPHLIL
jgi:hypothetical protein